MLKTVDLNFFKSHIPSFRVFGKSSKITKKRNDLKFRNDLWFSTALKILISVNKQNSNH